jgi:hypothetical protein
LESLHSVLRQNDLSSPEELRALTDGDLSEMGISIGDKVRLKRALKEKSSSARSEYNLYTSDEVGMNVDTATLDDLKAWLKKERVKPGGCWTLQRRDEGIGYVGEVALFDCMLSWGTSDDGKNMQVYLSPRENSMIEIEKIFMKFFAGDDSYKTDLEWEKSGELQPVIDVKNLEVVEDDELEDEEE